MNEVERKELKKIGTRIAAGEDTLTHDQAVAMAALRARRIEAEMALLEEQEKARAAQLARIEELATTDPKRAKQKAEKLARKRQAEPHTFVCRGCAERFSRARNATGPDVWKCDHCGHDNTPPRLEGRIVSPYLADWHHEQQVILNALRR